MIVDTDFLDHWKTVMVIDALNDKAAPIYILRLWAHCQERKSDVFSMPSRGLKAQCRFDGDHEALEAALVEAGFIERDGDNIKIVGWAEKNASLIAAWENGNKGGRPSKKPTDNPLETHWKPTGNPDVTDGQPSGNPLLTQTKPIRVDKSREEEILSAFGQFWSVYPNKVAKPAALKAFRSAKINGHLPEVIADIEAKKQTTSWTKNNGEFIPMPSTYLNQRRWEDGITEQTASPFAGAI